MKIIIGGDLVPTHKNIDYFVNEMTEELLGKDLYNVWHSNDIRIFNLETPLVDLETPIDKCGPNLMAPTKCIKGIKQLNPSLITLANNHILDQGHAGLMSTEKLLADFDIPFIGSGENLVKAQKPYIFRENNLKIGVYSCAENEFTIAEANKAGANPFDPFETLDHISNLKEQCDYVIVLYHGGKEHYPYPSPYLQKVCRKIVDKGADFIICQHSHSIGCEEKYNDSTIVYGQGNFIFDNSDNEYWKTSLLIEIVFNEKAEIKYIPFVKQSEKIRLANNEENIEIISNFMLRSKQITEPNFIENKYADFARENIYFYLRSLAGSRKWISRFDRIILKNFLLKKRFTKTKLLAIYNYLECEAHRELLITGLKGENYIEGNNSTRENK